MSESAIVMSDASLLICDGCGQRASSGHLARRLLRLERSSRFRPVHIHNLLVAGAGPEHDEDYLYFAGENSTGSGREDSRKCAGDAREVLLGSGISVEGKSAQAVLAEFQRQGLFLIYVMECPLEAGVNDAAIPEMLAGRMPSLMTRIRRSLRPRRVILVSGELRALEDKFRSAQLGCPVEVAAITGSGQTAAAEMQQFRELLANAAPAR